MCAGCQICAGGVGLLSTENDLITNLSCFLDTAATDVPLTPILEGFVILEKNPNYVEG